MTLQAGGNIGGQTPDVGSAAEVTVDTTGLSAELPTGGVRINFIPRDGGNRFANSTFFTMSNSALQGDNFTDELKAAGLATPNEIVQNWDINESFGGPFKKDKVWFWFSTRYNGVENEAPVFNNLNAYKPNEWRYVPDAANRRACSRAARQQQPPRDVAGDAAQQDCRSPTRRTRGATARTASARLCRAGSRARPPLPAPPPGALRVDLAGDEQAAARGRRHAPVRALGQHAPPHAGSRRSSPRSSRTPILAADDPGDRADDGSELPRGEALNYNNTLVPNCAYRVGGSYVTGAHASRLASTAPTASSRPAPTR